MQEKLLRIYLNFHFIWLLVISRCWCLVRLACPSFFILNLLHTVKNTYIPIKGLHNTPISTSELYNIRNNPYISLSICPIKNKKILPNIIAKYQKNLLITQWNKLILSVYFIPQIVTPESVQVTFSRNRVICRQENIDQ